jgi:hypothetical protein
MTSPDNWGKHFWYVIHLTALAYPDTPSINEVATYKSFYETYGKILPCKKCRANYKRHLEELPIENALSSRRELFNWTVQLHNIVNQDTGKGITWDSSYAESFFISGAYDKCQNSTIDEKEKHILYTMVVLNIVLGMFLVWLALRRK